MPVIKPPKSPMKSNLCCEPVFVDPNDNKILHLSNYEKHDTQDSTRSSDSDRGCLGYDLCTTK